jgi:pimeloyl-ACP methyl ester carboxylesterase
MGRVVINKKRDWNLSLLLIGIILVISSLTIIDSIDYPLTKSETVTFQDFNGDRLVGEYTRGNRFAGVLILEGFGSDQMAMKSIASEFASVGFHVFTFDFSGQGRSAGTLTFDNAATYRLAKQVIIAKNIFKLLSGLPDSRLIIVGHSMGARVALQSATFDPNKVGGLILLGAQVNLELNVQSDFFTGISDTSLFWVLNLSSYDPPVDILLLSGSWDDIVTPRAAKKLYLKLGAELSPYTRDIIIYDYVFHNYEIYNPVLISDAINWALRELGLDLTPNYFAMKALIRKIIWIVSLIGFIIIPLAGARYIQQVKKDKNKNRKVKKLINRNSNEKLKNKKMNNEENSRGYKYSENDKNIEILESENLFNIHIHDITKFFKFKLLAWLGSLPIALALLSLFFLIPIGVPIFSLFFVGFLSSYGIFMLILYLKNKMPGTEGEISIKFRFKNFRREENNIIAIATSILFIISCLYLYNSGINFVFPFNTSRSIWLIIFSFLTIPGFYIGQNEAKALKKSGFDHNKYQFGLWIIGLVPFFGISILFALIGSISGFIGSIQGILVLIFVIISGNFIAKIASNPSVAIIYQSFLIQFLALTQGSLFAIF